MSNRMHLNLLTTSVAGSTRAVLDPIAAIRSHDWILRDMDLGDLMGLVSFLPSQYHSWSPHYPRFLFPQSYPNITLCTLNHGLRAKPTLIRFYVCADLTQLVSSAIPGNNLLF